MRAVLFCNETLGLGHLGISLSLAGELASGPDDTALIVTGSPAFGGLKLPDGVDILKVPTAPVGNDSAWRLTGRRSTAGLALEPDQINRLRAELYRSAIEHVEPDAVIVDYRPLGRDGDLIPALELAREQGGATVALGIWDCDDAADVLREQWSPELMSAAASYYDMAFVYGPPAEDDVRVAAIEGAGLDVHVTGFVSAPLPDGPAADMEPGYLLATTGGGVDGFEMLDALLGAIRLRALPMTAVLVAGPFMAADEFDRLRAAAEGLDVKIFRSRADIGELLAGSAAVVSMSGYCTSAEVLASGKPALMVPRAVPREEQLNRARRLAAEDLVAVLEPAELSAESMRAALEDLLERETRPAARLSGAVDVRAALEKRRAVDISPRMTAQ